MGRIDGKVAIITGGGRGIGRAASLLRLGFAAIIGQQFPDLGGWRYLAAFAFVVAFTLSILVHELAHALMAMRFRSVTFLK